MNARLGLVLSSFVLMACSARNPIEPGAYTSHSAPHDGVQVSVDADKKTVTFTVPGGATVKRTATAWDAAKWPTLCPRGMKDTASEVIELGPEPLVLGAARIERPALVANCLHKPILELMSIGADGRPMNPPLASFSR